MENSKFLKVTKGGKHYSITINKGDILMYNNSYTTYTMVATPTRAQISTFFGTIPNGMEVEPCADRDLLKLWSHATIERKYGVYATKPHLMKELKDRGYTLSEDGHRWFKEETVKE